MALGPFEQQAGDLAPGDRNVLEADWSDFRVERLRSPDHPLFASAYERLWAEFGAAGEMERRDVIAERLAWDPRVPIDGHALLYEMVVLLHRGGMVAVRDHTAMRSVGDAASAAGAVVHLSHVLVEPSMRGRGLAAWLRALPLQAARECAAMAGLGAPGDVTLVAEMEHADGVTPAVMSRLRSYASAGFRVVDPSRTPYQQPDFRSADEIDRSGIQPLPLALVLRRVGREQEPTLMGLELRELVAALHAMFAVHVRADHMEPLRRMLERFPDPDDRVALLSPLHVTAV